MNSRRSEIFQTASYRAQVARLGHAARVAIRAFPIQPQSIQLLNHGENTTFRIAARGGRTYTLRVHRLGYHTTEGILEEARWIRALGRIEGVQLPVPVRARNGKACVRVEAPALDGPRDCTLLAWVDGRFKSRGLTERDLRALGRATARMHLQSRGFRPRVRAHYWNASGLIGTRANFGGTNAIEVANSKQQALINRGRAQLYRKLVAYQRRRPDRMGMIHADLHFGNVLWDKDSIGVIDFDDCGCGFHMYDLAVTCWALQFQKTIRNKNRGALRAALLEGYESLIALSAEDRKMIDDLIAVRHLVLLGWLQSRSDNPKLRPFAKIALKRTVKALCELVSR